MFRFTTKPDFTHHYSTCRLRRLNSRLGAQAVNEIGASSHLRVGARRLRRRATPRTLGRIRSEPCALRRVEGPPLFAPRHPIPSHLPRTARAAAVSGDLHHCTRLS